MLPSFTPVRINVILHYLERSGAIVIDADGYITWIRNEGLGHLTLGEVANMKATSKNCLRSIPKEKII